LTVEHRAARSLKPMKIELVEAGEALTLELAAPAEKAREAPSSLDERITAALAGANRSLPFAELKSRCRVPPAILYERLAALAASGHLARNEEGYRIASTG
jgi:hypothetical protein